MQQSTKTEQVQHTPGPWAVARLRHCQAIEQAGDTNSRICTLYDHHEHREQPCGSVESQDKPQDEIDANARLIAAAPEMAEACQKALKVFQSMTYTDHSDEWAAGEAQELIEAALAKARGG